MTASPNAPRGATIGRRTLALMLTASAAIGTARADDDIAPDVVVFCEPTLLHALEQVGALWRRRSGVPVRIFDSPTALLLEQIGHGVRSDIIIGEGEATAAAALQRRLIKAQTRFGGWRNRLVVAQRGGAPSAASLLSRDSTLLTLADSSSIAIVDPPVAAAGAYSRQALDALGLWEGLQGHTLGVVDTDEAAFLLDGGTARLAVVYATDVVAHPGLAVAASFADDTYPPIVYWGAETQQVRSPRTDHFASFLRQAEAQETLRKSGLEVQE
jgi:molybdate transport system substrate-binding protein